MEYHHAVRMAVEKWMINWHEIRRLLKKGKIDSFLKLLKVDRKTLGHEIYLLDALFH